MPTNGKSINKKSWLDHSKNESHSHSNQGFQTEVLASSWSSVRCVTCSRATTFKAQESTSAGSVQRRSTWTNRNQANDAPAPATQSERSNSTKATVLAAMRNALKPKRLYWRKRWSISESNNHRSPSRVQRGRSQAKPAQRPPNTAASSDCHPWAVENRTKNCTQLLTQAYNFT